MMVECSSLRRGERCRQRAAHRAHPVSPRRAFVQRCQHHATTSQRRGQPQGDRDDRGIFAERLAPRLIIDSYEAEHLSTVIAIPASPAESGFHHLRLHAPSPQVRTQSYIALISSAAQPARAIVRRTLLAEPAAPERCVDLREVFAGARRVDADIISPFARMVWHA